MDKVKQLNVFCHERKVGTLTLYKERLAALAYDNDWLKHEFSISPFSLPLEKRVFLPNIDPFDGLFGTYQSFSDWKSILTKLLLNAKRPKAECSEYLSHCLRE